MTRGACRRQRRTKHAGQSQRCHGRCQGRLTLWVENAAAVAAFFVTGEQGFQPGLPMNVVFPDVDLGAAIMCVAVMRVGEMLQFCSSERLFQRRMHQPVHQAQHLRKYHGSEHQAQQIGHAAPGLNAPSGHRGATISIASRAYGVWAGGRFPFEKPHTGLRGCMSAAQPAQYPADASATSAGA